MKTTDWKYDFSSLPNWDVRKNIPFVYDEFYEIPHADILCCIYSVAEVSMCNYLGFLAILKNKRDPELVLSINSKICFREDISINSKGDLLFLKAIIHNNETNEMTSPVIIIDIVQNIFAVFDTAAFNPCYKVIELNENTFEFETDDYQTKHDKQLKDLSRKKIKIERLKWYDFSEFNNSKLL